MGSLVGKALAVRNQGPPVPVGPGGGIWSVPGLAMGGTGDEILMRAYGTNGTVFANVALLASSTAKPEWRLYRKPAKDGRVRYTTSDQGSDERQEVVKHQALNVLQRPASITVNGKTLPVFTRFRLFEISGLWLELTGKCHWVVDYAEGPRIPLGLWPVRPDRMTPAPDRQNYLAGWIYTAPGGREKIPLLPDEVIYNCYPDPLDPYGGVGPISSVLNDIDAARAAAEWNRNFFINSAEPGGVIQADHNLEEEEFNQFVNRWRESHRGVARAHAIALLEAGMTWVPNSHGQRDMEFVAGQNLSRDKIREALGMHKVMTGVTDDVNRANAQTGEEVFASWKVSPRLDRWKDVLNHQFLPLFGAAGDGVEFDYVYPMPQNREADNLELTAKANAALALVTAGYDQHDVLEAVGLPDMGVSLELSTQPALPPRWTSPASAAPAPPGPESPDAPDAAPAAPAGPEDVLRRQMAAWNALERAR